MATYLTLDEFKELTLAPGEFVDAIEAITAGWTLAQLGYWSAWIDSRLRKRYAAPFATPVPDAVKGWLARIVTVRCYLKRGVNAVDEQYRDIKADCDAALVEIKEAAESVEGLFDLPLRADTTASGLRAPSTLVYSEQSPYAWHDAQARVGHTEDANGGGTFG